MTTNWNIFHIHRSYQAYTENLHTKHSTAYTCEIFARIRSFETPRPNPDRTLLRANEVNTTFAQKDEQNRRSSKGKAPTDARAVHFSPHHSLIKTHGVLRRQRTQHLV